MYKDTSHEEPERLPISGRVVNLLFLIDELNLDEYELSDLSACVYKRLNQLAEFLVEQEYG
jgi:hypothetical protein